MIDFSTLEKKCPVCGKDFIAREEWVFKRTNPKSHWPIYICSYSCLKEFDKTHKAPGKRRHFVRRVDV